MYRGITLAIGVFWVATSAFSEENKSEPKPDNTVATPTTAVVDKNADNTERNKRERNAGELTPTDQKENKADLETTRQIRKAIVEDKNLSINAHNVKIITRDGAVTLKGPVKSAAEKAEIEKKATDVAGTGRITSQIEIAP